MIGKTTTNYYNYDGIPCRVLFKYDGMQMIAEAYHVDHGFRPISVTTVRYYGELISEKEFKVLVASLRRKH